MWVFCSCCWWVFVCVFLAERCGYLWLFFLIFSVLLLLFYMKSYKPFEEISLYFKYLRVLNSNHLSTCYLPWLVPFEKENIRAKQSKHFYCLFFFNFYDLLHYVNVVNFFYRYYERRSFFFWGGGGLTLTKLCETWWKKIHCLSLFQGLKVLLIF